MDFLTVFLWILISFVTQPRDKQGEALHMLPNLNQTNFGKFFVTDAESQQVFLLFLRGGFSVSLAVQEPG